MKDEPATSRTTATTDRALRDLKAPWRSRMHTDRYVTGAIELAYLRGVQAGREQAEREAKERGNAKS